MVLQITTDGVRVPPRGLLLAARRNDLPFVEGAGNRRIASIKSAFVRVKKQVDHLFNDCLSVAKRDTLCILVTLNPETALTMRLARHQHGKDASQRTE